MMVEISFQTNPKEYLSNLEGHRTGVGITDQADQDGNNHTIKANEGRHTCTTTKVKYRAIIGTP